MRHFVPYKIVCFMCLSIRANAIVHIRPCLLNFIEAFFLFVGRFSVIVYHSKVSNDHVFRYNFHFHTHTHTVAPICGGLIEHVKKVYIEFEFFTTNCSEIRAHIKCSTFSFVRFCLCKGKWHRPLEWFIWRSIQSTWHFRFIRQELCVDFTIN